MNPAENYILSKPEPYKSILLQLQIIIESSVPELELKFKWSLPYYYLNKKPFCFLNVSKGYVDVGFRMNDNLKPFNAFLVGENRKVMKSLRYYSIEEINSEILIGVLKEIKISK